MYPVLYAEIIHWGREVSADCPSPVHEARHDHEAVPRPGGGLRSRARRDHEASLSIAAGMSGYFSCGGGEERVLDIIQATTPNVFRPRANPTATPPAMASEITAASLRGPAALSVPSVTASIPW